MAHHQHNETGVSISVLQQIAHFQNRRDEVPNRELAKQLAETKNKRGIREIADNLWNDSQAIQSDCLKVLYEVGSLNPKLIAEYVDDFLKLLQSKNNRLVWGGMTALAAIAPLKAQAIYDRAAEIQAAIASGSVITVDNGIQTLTIVAATDDARRKALLPYLLKHLATCRPKDVPQHAEKIVVALDASHTQAFVQVLEKRMSDLNSSQAARVKRVMKAAASG